MQLIGNAIATYLKMLLQSYRYLIKNSIFMVIGALMFIVIILVKFATASLPLFGYLISALVESACYSSYLYIVERASLGYNVDWQDAKAGVYVYTRVIMGLVILNNFIMIFLVRFSMMSIWPLLGYLLMVLIAFNALPEVITNKHLFVMDSLKQTIVFERKNALAWFAPNLIVIVLFMAIRTFLTIGLYSFNVQFSIKMALSIIVSLLVLQFVGGIIMIFRQLLFRSLESGKFNRQLRIVK